ncbi:MAG: hypothetical protein AAGI30_11230 [Planctomycetota bacterium]
MTVKVSSKVIPSMFVLAASVSGAQPIAPYSIPIGAEFEIDLASTLGFTPDGTRYLNPGYYSQNIVVYDATTDDPVMDIPLPARPVGLDVSSDGSFAVTAFHEENQIAVVDLSTGMVTQRIDLSSTVLPASVLLMADDDTVAVFSESETVENVTFDDFEVVSLSTGTTTLTVPDVQTRLGIGSVFGTGGARDFIGNIPIELDATRVLNPDGNEVQVIDTTTGSIARFPLQRAAGVTVSTDGTRFAGVGTDGDVIIRNTSDLSVVQVISHDLTTFVDQGIAMNADGTKVFIHEANQGFIYDVATGDLSTSLFLSGSGERALPSASGRYVFMVGFGLDIVDLEFEILESTAPGTLPAIMTGGASPVDDFAIIRSGRFSEFRVRREPGQPVNQSDRRGLGSTVDFDGPARVALSADGSVLVASGVDSESGAIVDVREGTVREVFATGDFALQPTITPDGTKALVPNDNEVFVTVADLTTTPATVTNVPVFGSGAFSSAASLDNNFAFVALRDSTDSIVRVNLNTNAVDGDSIFVGDFGRITGSFRGLYNDPVVSPDGSLLAVPTVLFSSIALIDTASFTPTDDSPILDGFGVANVAFSPSGDWLAATNRDDNTITLLDVTDPNNVSFAPLIFAGGSDTFPDTAVTDDPVQIGFVDEDTIVALNTGSESQGSDRAYSFTVVEGVDGSFDNGLNVVDVPLVFTRTTEAFNIGVILSPRDIEVDQAGGRFFIMSAASSAPVFVGRTRVDVYDGDISDDAPGDPAYELLETFIFEGPEGASMAMSADGSTLVVTCLITDEVIVMPLGDGFGCDGADIALPFGTSDGFDLGAYLGFVASGNLVGDVDGDSDTDTDDVNAFITQLSDGCP